MLPEHADPLLFGPPLDWWCGVRREKRRLPLHGELRPEELPPSVLPHLLLNEVHDGGRRVRIRLVGSEHRRGDAEDRRGQWIGDFIAIPESRAFHERAYRTLHDARRPVWTEHRASTDLTVFDVQRLLLPLSSDGETVAFALVVKRKRRSASGPGAGDERILDARTFREIDLRVL